MWMPMAFWLVLAAFFVFGGRRRRWRRWEAHRELASAREDTIQHLEVRVARLEERLEFTEKLLAERAESPRAVT